MCKLICNYVIYKSSAHTYYILILVCSFSALLKSIFYYFTIYYCCSHYYVYKYNFYYSSKNLLLQLLHDGCLPTNTIYCPATTIIEPIFIAFRILKDPCQFFSFRFKGNSLHSTFLALQSSTTLLEKKCSRIISPFFFFLLKTKFE